MKPTAEKPISFVQNLGDCLKILSSAGQWRKDHGILYSPIWDPDNINEAAYLDEFYDYQAYVLYRGNEAIATATLADPAESKMDTWSKKLGSEYDQTDCLYVDDLAVIGLEIGTGIIKILLNEIERFARARGYASLRLDIDSRLDKLKVCYTRNGFEEVARADVGTRTSLFMAKQIK